LDPDRLEQLEMLYTGSVIQEAVEQNVIQIIDEEYKRSIGY
jgi:hypothetical protein